MKATVRRSDFDAEEVHPAFQIKEMQRAARSNQWENQTQIYLESDTYWSEECSVCNSCPGHSFFLITATHL